MLPFMNLYTNLFRFFLGDMIVCAVMLIIDIVHFVYIYKNELTFYLIKTEDKMMVKVEMEEDPVEKKWDKDIGDIEKKNDEED